MTEYLKVIVLEAVFDDSDIQTDYFARDRPLEKWYVCELEGKIVTEPKLRRAIEKLPAWLQALTWSFQKGEKYSMSDHYYGQLRAGQSFGLEIEHLASYPCGKRGIEFLLSVTHLSTFEMNDTKDKPLPASPDEIKKLIDEKEAKELAWRNDPERKLRVAKAHADTIANSTAVIDGRGFHVLTEQEKKEEIAKVMQKVAPVANQLEQKEEFCTCGVPKHLCITHAKPKKGNLLDYM